MSKFIEDLNCFKVLNLVINNDNKETYNEFTKYIAKPYVLKVTKMFLSHFKCKINARELLSAFLINNYKTDVLGDNIDNKDLELLNISKQLIDILFSDTPKQDDILPILDKYHNIFNIWKIKDKEELLSIMSKTHCQLNIFNNIKSDKKTEATIKKIESIAQLVDGDKAVKHIKSASKYGLIDEISIINSVIYNLDKAFWDIFTEELSQDPPNFIQFPKLVKQIYLRFINILPKKNKSLTKDYLLKYLDNQVIETSIKNNSYTLQNIYDLCIFCLTTLKTLAAPADNNLFDFYIEKVHQDILGDNIKLHEIISNVFKFLLEQLDKICFIKDKLK